MPSPVQWVLRTMFRFVPDRELIIISHNQVRNYRLSGARQTLLGVGACSLICWVAYSTGTYVANRELLSLGRSPVFEDGQMEEQFILSRLSDDTEEGVFSEAPAAEAQGEAKEIVLAAASGLESREPLLRRIKFLEDRIQHMENYRENFLDQLASRTQADIDDMERLIAKTGMNLQTLELQFASLDGKRTKPKPAWQAAAVAPVPSASDEETGGKGGPFQPLPETGYVPEQHAMEKLERLWDIQRMVSRLPVARPIQNARTTSGFGTRRDPFNGHYAMHTGLDFSGPARASVYSTADGVVKSAGFDGAYGRLVEVSHGMGLTTRYAHLAAISVRPGERVSRGQVVGIQGSSGRSTGSHLHYEVRRNGAAQDPKIFLEVGKHVLSSL